MDDRKSIYLGDGAYATLTDWGALLITANHHDPKLATDTVEIDYHGWETLKKFMEGVKNAAEQ